MPPRWTSWIAWPNAGCGPRKAWTRRPPSTRRQDHPGEWECSRRLRPRLIYRRRGPSLLAADRARIKERFQAVAPRSKTSG